jgi:hypothetical protein
MAVFVLASRRVIDDHVLPSLYPSFAVWDFEERSPWFIAGVQNDNSDSLKGAVGSEPREEYLGDF